MQTTLFLRGDLINLPRIYHCNRLYMHGTIKAVIFDLDGVIIDSNPVIESFWKSWTDKQNIELTDALVRQWIHGRKVGDTLGGLFSHLDDTGQTEIMDAAHIFDSNMHPGAIKGVVNFIQSLKKLQVPIGVVTSSHHSRMLKMLSGIGINGAFTHFITAEDVVNGKPHPEPYEKMRAKMNVPVEQCLVFEDAISGIQSAKAAGMHAIGIGDAFARDELLLHGACEVVGDFDGLQLADAALLLNNKTAFRFG
jgi:sugar-phosphatase